MRGAGARPRARPVCRAARDDARVVRVHVRVHVWTRGGGERDDDIERDVWIRDDAGDVRGDAWICSVIGV